MHSLHLVADGAGRHLLVDARGRRYQPAQRAWAAASSPPVQAPAQPEEVLGWLQRESGFPFRPPIGVIGPREATGEHRRVASEVGRMLARCGFVVICGGRQGVMEAVCEGVGAERGIAVGLLPDEHWDAANPHVTIPIATGIGVARNAVIARAAGCLIAIGGGYGTHSEMAFGLQFQRRVFALLDAPAIPGAVRLDSTRALPEALVGVVLAEGTDG